MSHSTLLAGLDCWKILYAEWISVSVPFVLIGAIWDKMSKAASTNI